MRNELINYTTYISKLLIVNNVILSKKLEIICSREVICTAAKKDLYYFRQWSVLDKIDILKCVLRF